MCKLASSTELRQSISPRYCIHCESNLFVGHAQPVTFELILSHFGVLHLVRLNPQLTSQSELVIVYLGSSFQLRYFRDWRFIALNTLPIRLDRLAFKLHLEHQMAEESIDSGVSSEHSQYALEQVRASNDCNQFTKACGPILLPRSQLSHTEGYYGPRPPYPTRFYSYFDPDCYSDQLVHSHSKFGRPFASFQNRPLYHSFDSASEAEFSDSKSNSIQLSTSRALSTSRLVLPRQFEFDTKSEQFETMSSNPLDHARGSFHPQGSSSNVQDIRGGNPRMVHFVREQQQQQQRLYEVGTTYDRSSPTNINVVDRLTGLAGVGAPAVDPRPPLQRNYSTRDYAYLPPLEQNLINSPLTSPSQPTDLQVITSQSSRVGEVPGVQVNRNYPLDINALNPIANSSGHLQDYDRIGGRTTLEGLLRDFSLGSRSTEQQKQLLCALLTGSTKSAVSSVSKQTSLLQNVVQKPNATSSASIQLHTASSSQNQPFLFKRPPLHRSCYSSGDEESVTQGHLQGVNTPRTNLYSPPRFAHPQSSIISNQTQSQPTMTPCIPVQPTQPPPSLNMTQQVMSQLAQLQTFKPEDYANYQSLEAILGQLYPQPPPPAPVQPDIYGLKTRLLEDYYAPPSIASTSITQASIAATLPSREPLERKSGPLSLQIDPLIGVESGQLDDPTDTKLEERFADFFLLPSERCVTTAYPTSSGQIASSEYEWNLTNPDNPRKALPQRSENLSGILVIDLVAGNGLSSSQVLLRDLYCVIEMDSIRKARSMIRTSTSYFEWNEVFELDMDENRFLAFLLYQWDPRTKHRLCFYGGIDLRNLVQRLANIPPKCTMSSNLTNQRPRQNFLLSPALSMIPTNFDKIALQLEPRGILYLEFTHYPLERVYHRYQPTVSTSLQHASISDDVLFGVPIDELIERERVVAQLMRVRFPSSSAVSSLAPEHAPYVPLFIRKCVEEIDRRGTDVVGIYRLAGSVWMKLQVRELFNRITKSTLRAIFRGDRKAVEAIIEAIDLSAERVPDIHALTGEFS
ncbi:hypothetical protein EG68_02615 [Paragonimus skrjabini miyazakii]|uniref:Rho GTPase-activating protein n=1 Tax=Paragonimus skrjabini miyazakii TaxID=59628 RepID=A0A8S9YYW3_9TREM|nr:hypothetical protein EG68_02615 [Paragonimus skrjabini miyazakii]